MRSAGLARVVIAAIAVLAVAVLPAAAGAATFPVTKLTDTADGVCNADCSLREAVIAANAAAGADVIALPAGTLTLSIPGVAEQAAATGDLDILAAGGTVTVRGAGVAATTIDANQVDRVFEVLAGARLELADLTVSDGSGSGSGVLVGTGGPGASLDIARAALTLHRKGGPAVSTDNDAAVTVTDSAFRDNGADPASVDATFGGSGLYLNDTSTATVARTAFTGNRAAFGGAGIYVNNDARLTLSQGTFTGNFADFGGGALWTQNDTTSTVTASTFTDNSAGFGGGAVFNQNDAVLAITGSTLTGNRALEDSNGGGAIYNQNDAKLTITGSTIAGNTATSNLGGGAIFNQNQAILEIGSSTISGNRHVPDPDSAGADRGGGAIYAQNQAITTLTNTTVSGNDTGVNGGAFALRNQPAVRATNVTITGNTAAGTGGVLHNGTIPAPGVASFELANTIAAGNLAAGLPSGCVGTAPPGSVVSLGNNVEPTASCGAPAAGDTTADPQLGPLAANGGATLTHAIASTSPAKDTANAARCPATDQRGIARPQFAGCDIGAFELAPAPPAPPAATPPPPAAKPAAVAFASFVRLPSTKKCVSRRSFRIRLRVPKGVVVSSAEIRLNGKRVKAIKRSRITAPVDLRNLPKGRVKVNIRIRLADGRTISGTRTYRTCAVKRKGSGKPRV